MKLVLAEAIRHQCQIEGECRFLTVLPQSSASVEGERYLLWVVLLRTHLRRPDAEPFLPGDLADQAARHQAVYVAQDGGARGDPSRIPALRPAFAEDGTVTAANASSISDGTAALVIADADRAKAQGVQPRARIASIAGHAGLPARFPCPPVPAMRGRLGRLGRLVDDVDLWEVNQVMLTKGIPAAA